MDARLQEIITTLKARLRQSRRFKDKLAHRIKRMDEDLARLKGPERKKKR